MTSRHYRPEYRLPFQLTTRDRAVLASVYRHRFLTAEHIRDLHFGASGVRVCQVRLQRLWAGRFLDRLYLPPDRPGTRDRYTERPLYSLAGRGTAIVAEDLGIAVDDIPHTPSQNRQGYATLRHHLVFTDLAVAVETVAAAEPGLHCLVTREDQLRRALLFARGRRVVQHPLVPDGAFTVITDGSITSPSSPSAATRIAGQRSVPSAPQGSPGTERALRQPACNQSAVGQRSTPGVTTPQTYVVEVVRAGVKAGNDTIRRRLHRYRAALRSGQLRDLYQFTWVRAVLFLTPTWQRAKNLAALARDVTGGDRLFRFGAYECRVPGRAAPVAALSPSTVTTPYFLTSSGATVALLDTISITSPPHHV